MSADRRLGDDVIDVVEFARDAVIEGESQPGEAGIGRHLATQDDSSGLTVLEFECLLPAYPGWRWTVVVAGSEPAGITICDVVLLPGEGALLAPRWVPWRERVQPGDLGPGDVLPSDPNDARLEPGYEPSAADAEVADEDLLDAVWELGLGRERVLSAHGRDVAVERWLGGSTGPGSAEAKLAPHPCATCGFFIGIKGSFNREFGVCANEFSSVDGRVVSVGFGCGAHSAIVEAVAHEPAATLDEFEYQSFDLRGDDAEHSGDLSYAAPTPATERYGGFADETDSADTPFPESGELESDGVVSDNPQADSEHSVSDVPGVESITAEPVDESDETGRAEETQ